MTTFRQDRNDGGWPIPALLSGLSGDLMVFGRLLLAKIVETSRPTTAVLVVLPSSCLLGSSFIWAQVALLRGASIDDSAFPAGGPRHDEGSSEELYWRVRSVRLCQRQRRVPLQQLSADKTAISWTHEQACVHVIKSRSRLEGRPLCNILTSVNWHTCS